MTRPTLEYTEIDIFTLSPDTASIAMPGPTGTKALVTLLISGAGAPSGLYGVEIAGIGAFSRLGAQHISDAFSEIWYRYNVPIGSSTTLDLGGPSDAYGGVEIGYWQAGTDTIELDSNSAGGTPFTALNGGIRGMSGFTEDQTIYGVMMGVPSSGWALWTSGGTAPMETIYPDHGTLPPTYTSSPAVIVGDETQVGAPEVCCGFTREPGLTNDFGFTFSELTTYRFHVVTLTGIAPAGAPAGVMASQFVTILG